MSRYTVQFCRDKTPLKWYIKAVFNPPYEVCNDGPWRFTEDAATVVIDDLSKFNIIAKSFTEHPTYCPSISVTLDNESDEAEFMMKVSSGLITLSVN